MERFVTVSNMKIGMPWEDRVEITPMPEMDRISYLDGLVKDALQKEPRWSMKAGARPAKPCFIPPFLHPLTMK